MRPRQPRGRLQRQGVLYFRSWINLSSAPGCNFPTVHPTGRFGKHRSGIYPECIGRAPSRRGNVAQSRLAQRAAVSGVGLANEGYGCDGRDSGVGEDDAAGQLPRQCHGMAHQRGLRTRPPVTSKVPHMPETGSESGSTASKPSHGDRGTTRFNGCQVVSGRSGRDCAAFVSPVSVGHHASCSGFSPLLICTWRRIVAGS